ncbi:MAG: hypothetical protein U0V87_16815 [Acidobacteriota bacterium]
MTVLDRLSSALGRRDERPNQALAREIVQHSNREAVAELVQALGDSDRRIKSDCIKVLYEVGKDSPSLIAGYCNAFGELLDSKHNRLVWGAMIALDTIAEENPRAVSALIAKIVAVANEGSVITRDHAVGILAKLGDMKPYAEKCVPLLIEQLRESPDNQFPMYAELSAQIRNEAHRAVLRRTIQVRLKTLKKESQQRRVLKVLRQLEAGAAVPVPTAKRKG